MNTKLNWSETIVDNVGIVHEYAAEFELYITDRICLHINYYVTQDNSNQWWLGIIGGNSDPTAPATTIRCNDPNSGKQLAQEDVQKILDGIKNVVLNM